jgi:hypothetical protein
LERKGEDCYKEAILKSSEENSQASLARETGRKELMEVKYCEECFATMSLEDNFSKRDSYHSRNVLQGGGFCRGTDQRGPKGIQKALGE